MGTLSVVGNQFYILPSTPNVVNSGIDSQNLYGGSTALKINRTSTGGAKDFFNLKSLRYACAVNTVTGLGAPTGCTILFQGNKPDGLPSVTYEVQYPNQAATPLNKAVFGTATFPVDFVGLTEVFVTITAAPMGVVLSTVNTLFDNVCLSIYG